MLIKLLRFVEVIGGEHLDEKGTGRRMYFVQAADYDLCSVLIAFNSLSILTVY